MKTIILIQHCQSEQHLNEMIGGITDWNLTKLGELQAENIGRKLSAEYTGDWTIYSSDLKRAAKTAQIVSNFVNSSKNCPIDYRKELREQNLGIATGKSKEWFNEHKNHITPNEPLIFHRSIEGAETEEEVYHRVAKFIQEIASSDDEQIMIVAHGGSCKMFAAIWMGITVEMLANRAFIGGAGGVTVLSERVDGARIMKVWNNLSYRE